MTSHQLYYNSDIAAHTERYVVVAEVRPMIKILLEMMAVSCAHVCDFLQYVALCSRFPPPMFRRILHFYPRD